MRITAQPLGRKHAKTKESYYKRNKVRNEAAERNRIEGRFGQGKNGYSLNEIRARLRATSESWVACIFFVMNLLQYEKVRFFGSIFKWLENVLSEIIIFLQLPELKNKLVYRQIVLPGGKFTICPTDFFSKP